MEEESGRRNHGRGIMEEESWRRNHGGDIMEETSWRRNHGGDVMEDASGRHLGGSWEAEGAGEPVTAKVDRHLQQNAKVPLTC